MGITVNVVSVCVDVLYLSLHSSSGTPHYRSPIICLGDQLFFLSLGKDAVQPLQ